MTTQRTHSALEGGRRWVVVTTSESGAAITGTMDAAMQGGKDPGSPVQGEREPQGNEVAMALA